MLIGTGNVKGCAGGGYSRVQAKAVPRVYHDITSCQRTSCSAGHAHGHSPGLFDSGTIRLRLGRIPVQQLPEAESDRRELPDQWIDAWSDIVDFEVIEVMTSADAVAKVTPQL